MHEIPCFSPFDASQLRSIASHHIVYVIAAFLRSIYHISLSSAPIPIERYVINFLQEVPLPPSGRTDVRYVMPNHLKMTMSRPPPNKLPMADFSFRPLFTCLSVENIIIVFQCLCAELTVCICSDNLSLLTPVQEAFLSFLFPLVWQGEQLYRSTEEHSSALARPVDAIDPMLVLPSAPTTHPLNLTVPVKHQLHLASPPTFTHLLLSSLSIPS